MILRRVETAAVDACCSRATLCRNASRRVGRIEPESRCRPSPYLNNIIEQDHRFVKKLITSSQGFRSAEGALSTIAGY